MVKAEEPPGGIPPFQGDALLASWMKSIDASSTGKRADEYSGGKE